MEVAEIIIALQAAAALARVWFNQGRAPTADEVAALQGRVDQLSISTLAKLDAIAGRKAS